MIKTYLRVLEDGRHIIEKEEQFNERMMALPVGLHVVTVDTAKNKRSSKQNAYYWAVVLGAFLEGYNECYGESISKERAHNTLKLNLHFKLITNEETGETVRVPLSTADENTKEFHEYVEKCRLWISEWFHTDTPDPDPDYKHTWYSK